MRIEYDPLTIEDATLAASFDQMELSFYELFTSIGMFLLRNPQVHSLVLCNLPQPEESKVDDENDGLIDIFTDTKFAFCHEWKRLAFFIETDKYPTQTGIPFMLLLFGHVFRIAKIPKKPSFVLLEIDMDINQDPRDYTKLVTNRYFPWDLVLSQTHNLNYWVTYPNMMYRLYFWLTLKSRVPSENRLRLHIHHQHNKPSEFDEDAAEQFATQLSKDRPVADEEGPSVELKLLMDCFSHVDVFLAPKTLAEQVQPGTWGRDWLYWIKYMLSLCWQCHTVHSVTVATPAYIPMDDATRAWLDDPSSIPEGCTMLVRWWYASQQKEQRRTSSSGIEIQSYNPAIAERYKIRYAGHLF